MNWFSETQFKDERDFYISKTQYEYFSGNQDPESAPTWEALSKKFDGLSDDEKNILHLKMSAHNELIF